MLDGRIQRKVEKLETALQREARGHVDKVNELQKSNQVAFTHFQVAFQYLKLVGKKTNQFENFLSKKKIFTRFLLFKLLK